MCRIHKASDYVTALQYLLSYTVILDIMGVDGFDLLRKSVARGFPTVMLTAHALSSESLKRSIKLGAVSFLPKEKLEEIESFLEDVVLGGGKSVWEKLFERLGTYFNRHLGSDWKERDEFFKAFEEELKSDQKKPADLTAMPSASTHERRSKSYESNPEVGMFNIG
jgi:hypothetical protein